MRVAEGMRLILRSCPDLQELNLTSCRSISTALRRSFFESMVKDEEEEASQRR